VKTLVPFSATRPKTRLTPLFSPDERRDFARAMLDDVLDAVRAAGGEPTVVATDPLDLAVPVEVDDRPLSAAVNARLDAAAPSADDPLAVVMADLALATPAALGRLFDAAGDVVIAPGRGGGTNALVVRHPDFRVDYHGVSYRDHREAAAAVGAAVATVDSFRLSTDVDLPADLVEVLLHSEGAAAAWLDAAGVRLVVTDGRVGVERG
jgi:2-phospho-L-lactate guanylyltransferase